MKNINYTENPDKWVVLKILDENNAHYKVFGSWAGGYLDGDRWKVNSGISKVGQDDSHFYFYGYSGSCYKCHKKGYGVIGSYNHDVLNKIVENSEGKVEVLEDNVDWFNLILK